MRAIDLAFKDIRQVLRDRQSLLFLLVMPFLFTFFFGFAFAPTPEPGDSRLQLGVVNEDPDGLVSRSLLDLLGDSPTIRPVMLAGADLDDIDSLVLKGELTAALVIPAGFSEDTLRGDRPKLEVIVDEESDGGQTMRRALQTSVTRMAGLVETAQLSAQAAESQRAFGDEAERRAYIADGVVRALAAWKAQPLSIQVTGPVVEEPEGMENPYNQFSPGMMVMFAMFGLVQAAMVMVVERKTGAMARMLTTPMKKTELFAGHTLGMFLIFFVQQALLVLFGQFALKVDYLREPLATLITITVLALFVSALGMLISALAKKEEHVILGAMAVMFLFSALGGLWFSLEMVGETFAFLGHLTPTAWAMDAFQNVLLRGQGTTSVLLPAAVILGYTLAFFGIAVWKFKY